jgi:hypothetical protein
MCGPQLFSQRLPVLPVHALPAQQALQQCARCIISNTPCPCSAARLRRGQDTRLSECCRELVCQFVALCHFPALLSIIRHGLWTLDFVHGRQTLGGRAAVSYVQQLRLGLHSGLSAPLCRGVVMPWHRTRRLRAPACSRVSTPAAPQHSRRQLYFCRISGLTVEACKSRSPYRQNQIAARRR